MPKRTDIKRILVIGSGPIVIGQACEFDYSGTQCCKVLMEEGYEAILVNSNPATIMTDPSMAARTYVEPITLESVERIIEIERPDALISTMGGQNGLNCGIALAENGVLERYGVEMIGCDAQAIARGEDRKLFVEAMESVGLQCARSGYAYSVDDALALAKEMGYPLVLRPSFTLGGAGGGIAYDAEELAEIVSQGLDLSQNGEVLVEESVLGWKEIEMEVMRDTTGACITVCSIENLDPMGVHTGDSITVAPAMTLTEKEYDVIEQASYDILRAVGVNGSGANIQFAVNPEDGRLIVIEMNPRVSRSSALASKATGFPIAKIATKLAIGYTFEEILNDITGMPVTNPITIDYVVVKVPRFAFEKFKGTDDTLTTRMKAVGEVMSIGRTFEEAMGKAMRSLEKGRYGLSADGKDQIDDSQFNDLLSRPTENRIYYVTEALQRGWSVEKLYEVTKIDPWFLNRIADVVAVEEGLRGLRLEDVDADMLRTAKRFGLSDRQIAYLTNASNCVLAGETAMATGERMVRTLRKALGVKPTFKIVDTCSGLADSATNYFYKTYEETSEVRPSEKPRAMILGAGPNRIGQGIEFDYCCVHASYALADMGYETVMVNCNPETVSTDYDTSDRLYFEPLTYEDVMDIVDAEDPAGVVVTLGGQTPLKLAHELEEAGVEIMGTKPEAIDLAEDRDRFSKVLDELGILYPAAGLATSPDEALLVAKKIGFPLLVRPSYVLGGRGMVIAYDEDYLMRHLTEAAMVTPDHPVYLDHFLEDAIEVDVDALCDGTDVYIGGILEHIEEAGIHSGDSSCCMPPFSLAQPIVAKLRDYTRRLALRLGVKGLLNVQYGIKDTNVYVIEANPRASRTVPFVSKASGVPLAKCAARIMAGESIASLGLPPDDRELDHYSVKEAVLPFSRFPGVDVILGPEMKSTGEVMGIARDFPAAFAKAALAIDYSLPTSGTAFISVNDRDKRNIVSTANELKNMGFHLISTSGTCRTLAANGIPVQMVRKFHEEHPNIGDMIEQGQVDLMINTPMGQETRGDGYHLRTAAVRHQVCYATTISGATAMTHAIEAVQEEYDVESEHRLKPIALQDLEQFEIG